MCNTCKKPNCNCGSNNHSHKRVLATIADIRATIAILNAKINEALQEINYPSLQSSTDRGNVTDNYITFKKIVSELNPEDLNKIYNSLTILQEDEVAKILFNTYIDKLEPTSIELSKEGFNFKVEDILSLAVTKDQASFNTKVSGLDAVEEQDFITLKQTGKLFVAKEINKDLVDTSQISKLENLDTQEQTNIKLSTKVDKVAGKSLVEDIQISKLTALKTQNQITQDIALATSNSLSELISFTGTYLPRGSNIPEYIVNKGAANLLGGVGANGVTYTNTGLPSPDDEIHIPQGQVGYAVYDKTTDTWSLIRVADIVGWETMFDGTIKSSAELDATYLTGVYKVSPSDNSFQTYMLQVFEVGGITRQVRTQSNISGIPTIEYRDYDSGASVWKSWNLINDYYLTGGIRNNQQLNETFISGIYRVIPNDPTAQSYLVEVFNVDGVTRQIRKRVNIEGIPFEEYRDYNISTNTWGSWINKDESIMFTGVLRNASQVDTAITQGIYKVVPTNPTYQSYTVQVFRTETLARQIRFQLNAEGFPNLEWRDYDVATSTWGIWNQFSDMMLTGKVNSNAHLDTILTTGTYQFIPSNPIFNRYLIFVSVSGNMVRQYRNNPNHSGEPYLTWRDTDKSVLPIVWTPWQSPTPPPTPVSASSLEANSEDVIWSWWNEPQIIRTRTDEGAAFNKIYTSYTDSVGNTGVIENNLDSLTVQKAHIKETILDIDDHNAGGVLKLPDGKLLTVFSGGHNANSNLLIYRSLKRESSAGGWEKLHEITMAGLTSYTQLLEINGVLYLFSRIRRPNTRWGWEFITSNDYGVTWSTAKRAVDGDGIQWYCTFKPVEGNTDLIRMVHYSNPSAGQPQIRGGFIKISTGEILNKDGVTVIGDIESETVYTLFDVIIGIANTGWRNRLFDVAVTTRDDWQILYAYFTNTQQGGTYRHYDNGVVRDICEAGKSFMLGSRYFGGAVFGENGDIYCSRFNLVNSKWIIERYTLVSGNYTVNEIIRNTSKVAVRPIYAKGVLAWQEGNYNENDYTDFNTQLMFKEV